MNTLHRLLPLVALFAYDALESRIGLGPALLASLGLLVVDVAWSWWKERRVSRLSVLSLLLVGVLGGLAWWTQDERFVHYGPVAGNVVFAIIAWASLLRRESLVVTLLEEQAPDLELEPGERHFFRGLTFRFGVVLLAHAAWIAWTAQHQPDRWAFVTGIGGMGLYLVQFAGEAAWLRWMVPREPSPVRAEVPATSDPVDPR